MQGKNKPLTLKPFHQSTALCGPASLKILLSFFGKNYSEKELAKLSGSTREIGTLHGGLINAAKKLRAQVTARDKGTIAELRNFLKKEIPVLVGWYDTSGEACDHYSVVYHVSAHYIYLMDPATNTGYRKMSIPKFLHFWYDFEGKHDEITVKRWYLVLSF